jgi:hypothetical protein
MTVAGDTVDLLSTSLWGEVVTIVRNSPAYQDDGFGDEEWNSVADTLAEIQRISGNNPTRDLGQGRFCSHTIFLPDQTDVVQGDRIRSSEWTTGRAEFEVQVVMADTGHTEVRTRLVRSTSLITFLLLEDGTDILLETGSRTNLE